MSLSKRCTKCGEVKSLSEFYANRLTKDSLTVHCKMCHKEATKIYRLKNADKVRAYERQYKIDNREKIRERKMKYAKIPLTEEQIIRRRVSSRKWNKNNREKRRCSLLVWRKLFAEKPETCSLCGSSEKIEAHHEDYSKPLDVVWCCFLCHRKLHRKYS